MGEQEVNDRRLEDTMPELNEDRACTYMWNAATRQERLSIRLNLGINQLKVVILGAAFTMANFGLDISFSTSSILTTVDCQSAARHAPNIRRGTVTETSANLMGEH